MEPEIDAEWMKFMSRITKKQNCDTYDNDDDDDDDDDIDDNDEHDRVGVRGGVGGAISFDMINGCAGSSTPAVHHKNVFNSTVNTTTSSGKPRKSCISKKTQRRTYSFIDTATELESDTCLALGADADADADADASSSRTAAASILNNDFMASDDNNIARDEGIISNRGGSSGSGDSIRSRFTPIYISTKTKIAYLSRPVDIYDIFWKIPVQHYYKRKEGVIKKQIKFQTTDPAVVASIKQKLEQQSRYYEEYIIEHIDNPNGRIPYKDQRKVSIGLCNKDFNGGNQKKKRAFFNCFAVILRINGGIAPPEERAPEDDILYKEMHVKVFNTGKLEIPGIQEDKTLIQVLRLLVTILRPFLGEDLDYLRNRCETALINSNFNCGYYIDRDKLFHLLKYKYRMNCNYDSCSYPGIQVKFYYIPGKSNHEQNGQQPVSMDIPYYEVSFMIFRTGSILIVGKCNEDILNVIYRYICLILEKEFAVIQMGLIPSQEESLISSGGGGSGRNTRKKKIVMTNIQYYIDSDESNIEE